MNRQRPPMDATPAIVIIMLLILGCALLMRCSESEARGPSTAVVAGTITLTIINPPEPVSCQAPGWTVVYIATGTAYRAARFSYLPAGLSIDLTPALEQCIHVDGFEA